MRVATSPAVELSSDLRHPTAQSRPRHHRRLSPAVCFVASPRGHSHDSTQQPPADFSYQIRYLDLDECSVTANRFTEVAHSTIDKVNPWADISIIHWLFKYNSRMAATSYADQFALSPYTKLNKDGGIDKYKPRLMVKGYAQKQGIDYIEVYARLARRDTILNILSLVAQRGIRVHQLDMNNASLYGDLTQIMNVEQTT
ncbi:hypothetical protein LXL04_014042 [Taraxacum kok-saghyz]